MTDKDMPFLLLKEQNAHEKTLEQRDHASDKADQLAYKIAEFAGVDIGEHSNLNCPWDNALEIDLTRPDTAKDDVGELIHKNYLSLANAESDPWKRASYREASMLLKEAIRAAMQKVGG